MELIYHQVSSLQEAMVLLENHPENSKIVAGATDFWLEYKNGIHQDIHTIIDISRIKNLDQIYEDDHNSIHIGPLVTHAHCVRSELLQKQARCLFDACREVGSPQIRNRGTVVGNIVTGSPANDTISALMALNASIVATSSEGVRNIALSDFYSGVRKTKLKKNEIVTDIWFQKIGDNSFSFFKKQGLRKAQAISLLNVSVVCKYEKSYNISDMRIAFGSLAPTVVRANNAENYAKGKSLIKLDFDTLIMKATGSISPINDMRSTKDYRNHMAGILLRRGMEEHINKINNLGDKITRSVTLWGKSSSTYQPLEHARMNKSNSHITFLLNSEKITVKYISGQTVLDLIRNTGNFTGTKEGCGEGECGACTIFMDGIAVLACLIPAPRAEGTSIETIEYLMKNGNPNTIQKAFIEEGAVQCGYCTPGFVMSATKLLEELPKPTIDEIKIGISGNLCRCTGYYKIVTAIQKAAEMS